MAPYSIPAHPPPCSHIFKNEIIYLFRSRSSGHDGLMCHARIWQDFVCRDTNFFIVLVTSVRKPVVTSHAVINFCIKMAVDSRFRDRLNYLRRYLLITCPRVGPRWLHLGRLHVFYSFGFSVFMLTRVTSCLPHNWYSTQQQQKEKYSILYKRCSLHEYR